MLCQTIINSLRVWLLLHNRTDALTKFAYSGVFQSLRKMPLNFFPSKIGIKTLLQREGGEKIILFQNFFLDFPPCPQIAKFTRKRKRFYKNDDQDKQHRTIVHYSLLDLFPSPICSLFFSSPKCIRL